MIFFTKNIRPFKANNGMKISPIACELKTGEVGYYLSDSWKQEIEKKGATTREISKNMIKTDEDLI